MNKALLLMVVGTLSACAGATVTRLKTAPARPLDCDLEIFATEAEVPKKFETLCLVEAHTGTGLMHDRTAAGALAHAKPKLCECGADAAIIVEAQSKQSSDWTASVFTPIQDQRGNVSLRGIRYLK